MPPNGTVSEAGVFKIFKDPKTNYDNVSTSLKYFGCSPGVRVLKTSVVKKYIWTFKIISVSVWDFEKEKSKEPK